MTATAYRYTIENDHRACRDAIAEEIAEMQLGEFQGAMDLPDGTEFATGSDADGNAVKVYRVAE